MKLDGVRTQGNFRNPLIGDKGLIAWLVAAGIKIDANIDKNIADFVAFYRAVAVSVTNVTLFPDNFSVANSNLTTNVRPENEHAIIKAIRFLSGANAALNATDWVPGLSSAELQNGKFSILVNGVRVLPPTYLTVFNLDGSPDSPGLWELDHPIIWPGQQKISVEVTFDVAPAAANQNIAIELVCSAMTS